MSTPEQFARKLEKVARELPDASRKGVNEAAGIFKVAVDSAVAGAIGSDRELSGIPKLKVGAKLLTASSDVKPTAIVKGDPPSVFTIVESGALPHVVGARTAKGKSLGRGYGLEGGRVLRTLKSGKDVRSKVSGRLLMSTGDWAAYGPFIAGGSKGKKPFASALRTVGPRMAQIVQRETSKATLGAFR